MPSLIDLTNRALSELGKNPIASINDSPIGIYVSNKILELLPEVLLECNWNWAIKYVDDSSPLSQTITPDYTYTYQLPGDFGKFYKFASTGAQWPVYEFIDGYLCAQTLPVQYYYIVNFVNLGVLTPLVSRALVLYAAAKSAPTQTNNVGLVKYLEMEYEKIKTKAILENDMERSVQTTPYNDFDRITYV